MTSSDSYPLKWPVGRLRTAQFARKHAAFKTSLAKARNEMLDELRLMKATSIVISTNVATYKRGGVDIPYVNQVALNEDPGAAVYFTWNGDQYALACDQWKNLADNIQAIRKTIEAIRGIARWGTGEMMKAAFAGFKALPAPGVTGAGRPWWQVLMCMPSAPWPVVEKAYHQARKRTHPDAGGTNDAFIDVQHAWEAAKKERDIK